MIMSWARDLLVQRGVTLIVRQVIIGVEITEHLECFVKV